MVKLTPSISVVIPAFNAGTVIGRCLESVKMQDYPRIEIIVVDDKSSDDTVKIARKYTSSIYFSGRHFCEYSKSLGILKSKNDLVLLLDSDNILPSNDFLSKLVKPLIENKDIIASYPVWFNYDRADSLMDRYCSLFGINDPYQFYLKKRDRLMIVEKEWTLTGKLISDENDYFHVRFAKGDILTLGTISFLIRRKVLLKTNCNPYFFHIDALADLISKGYSDFAMVKESIIHKHSSSLGHFLGKLYRNALLFFKNESVRSNSWALNNKTKFILVSLVMATLVVPFFDSVKGFIKKRDVAWFIHPVVCFTVPILYFSIFLRRALGLLK